MLGKSHKIGDFRSTSNIQDLPTMKTRNHKHALLFEMIGEKKQNTATGTFELQMSPKHFWKALDYCITNLDCL